MSDNETTDTAIPGRVLRLTVNGTPVEVECEDRELLLDLVRDRLHLYGTHAGCRNGDCGACTVRVDGDIVKSCLVFAATVEGADVTTVDGLGTPENLSAVQRAFWDHDGFQCGFCLPGHLFAADDLLRTNPSPTESDIRHALQGGICRCTGYQRMITAIKSLADERRANPA